MGWPRFLLSAALPALLLLALTGMAAASAGREGDVRQNQHKSSLFFTRYQLETNSTLVFVMLEPDSSSEYHLLRTIEGEVARLAADMTDKLLYFTLRSSQDIIFRTQFAPSTPATLLVRAPPDTYIGGFRVLRSPRPWLMWAQVHVGMQIIYALEDPMWHHLGLPFVVYNSTRTPLALQMVDMDVNVSRARGDMYLMSFAVMLVDKDAANVEQTVVEIQEVVWDGEYMIPRLPSETATISKNATKMWGIASGRPDLQGIFGLVESTECGTGISETQMCLRRFLVNGTQVQLVPHPVDSVVSIPAGGFSAPRLVADWAVGRLYYIRKGVLTAAILQPPKYDHFKIVSIVSGFGDVVTMCGATF